MKSHWLNKQNNKNLIVFFAGWSFDETPFKDFNCKSYDVLMIYDYNDLSIPKELKNLTNYESKTLISWSMGVYTACLLKDLFLDFQTKIAINGTTKPVDNEFGIPIKTFELTLRHAAKGLEGKFYQNVFNTNEEFEKYNLTPVKRDITNRVEELANLYDLIKNNDTYGYEFYDFAIVSDFDKIIPPKNQITCHDTNNTPVITLPYGHFPFYNFNSWDEVTKCQQITKI